MSRVQFHSVTKDYGAQVAVDALDLDIRDGEFLVLVGPSGCGKSTTLRMLAGLEAVSSGQILIGDRDVTKLAPRDRDIAMVFQSYALYPHMTVAQNMAFGLKNRGMKETQALARVRDIAETLELTEMLDRRPRHLSGGQRQRVALGRAIVRQPGVFLMDEPLSNLDAQLRISMRGELIELHQRLGRTTVYVTHDQVEALTMGSRIAVMRGGKIEQVDTPEALYDKPANSFVGRFIGSPSMNMLTGSIGSEAGEAIVGVGSTIIVLTPSQARRATGHALNIGIRPEHIRVDEPSDVTGWGKVEGVVGHVEQLGEDIIVSATTPGGHILAKGARRQRPAIGETVNFWFDPVHVHLFDSADGSALES